ncbi:lon-related putative ATP-dependent protease [Proteiniclasticum ruminis]|uniref:endopeptidase La n=2 Tax=Proteiniclasticum ruminis TaxID=398199 RepID=A0A1G8IAC6_9CLOT|nr:AAA family ATPase [Proteiniclasticum ruminis]SDI15846.1 lon-related putative ATP-dependent protease [Proteiniclasticum ruminis]
MDQYKVPVEKLTRRCSLEELQLISNRKTLPMTKGVIGQERATRAMEFGLHMEAKGYHIFVVGPPGTGRTSYTEAIVKEFSKKKKEKPLDYCYIHNFRAEDRPIIVELPMGEGKKFQREMEEFIEDLKSIIPKVFEDGAYEKRRDEIVLKLQEKLDALYDGMKRDAENEGFLMKPVPPRFVFIPLKDGKQMAPESFEKLSPEDRKNLDEKGRKLTKALDDTLKESQRLEDDAREYLRKIEETYVLEAVRPKIARLQERYRGYEKIENHLLDLTEDLGKNYASFRGPRQKEEEKPQNMFSAPEKNPLLKYQVHVFVDNEDCKGAPVVYESHPTYYHLFGKLEYTSHMLSVETDFTMLRPGSIHRANGGFLILQMRDILRDPNVWEPLKKALKHDQAVVENIGEEYRLIPSGTLRPEPVPLKLKVIIICDPELYHFLYQMDEDLERLFKVRVDFDLEMKRTTENVLKYAAFVEELCRREGLSPFSVEAMDNIVEYGSRIAGDQSKLTTRFNKVTEVIYESEAAARIDGTDRVEEKHVLEALKERRHRENLFEDRMKEEILKDVIHIKTEGEEIGQINGLSVLSTGGYSFGMPSRITARTYVGDAGVINIERETRMSGKIHTKGVLTLSGYLGGLFAQDTPLSLTAQVTFEQSYGGVEGDSASSTELYAILSSLSGVPIRQSIAVTGSVDQKGEIQPIGGVTEKIEGFFDICKARGLTGEEGVLIPAQNISHLMLKEEVIEAVYKGLFSIYAVKHIHEGVEILMGRPAGYQNGEFLPGSVYDLAFRKIRKFQKAMEAKRE